MQASAKRVTLIHNPTAGWGDLSQTQLMTGLERGGYEVRAAHPDTGLGKRLAKQTDVVIAAGGDGTINAVARRMVNSNVPLIILPLGTANNLARTVEMQASIECALATLATPRERGLDIGVASGSWGERYFSESAGVGWFCDALNEEVDESHKTIENALEVLTKYLETYEPKRWHLELDGVDASGEYTLVEVMNAKLLGPNVQLAPRADPFDGLLDVVMVKPKDTHKLLTYLDGLRQGHDVAPPKLVTTRAKHVHFALEAEHLRVDDAVRPKRGSIQSHFADLRLLPGAVRLWLPPKKPRAK